MKIGPAKDIGQGKMKGVKAGGKEIVIANLGGKYHAIGNICTHMGCKLSGGKMNGDTVVCPCHASVFDLKTGKVLKGPASAPGPSYKVKVEDGDIMVEI